MEAEPVREHLMGLLRAWDAGRLDETQIRDAAEALERTWAGWEVLDNVSADAEPASLRATAEILTTLSDLHLRWVTRTDIPAMLACLETVDTDPTAAQTAWHAYGESVDWENRELELRSQPFYARKRRGVTGHVRGR